MGALVSSSLSAPGGAASRPARPRATGRWTSCSGWGRPERVTAAQSAVLDICERVRDDRIGVSQRVEGNGRPLEVAFDNGNHAVLVAARPGDDARGLLTTLGLSSAAGLPVMVVCGGADELQGEARERAASLLGPAVASAAALSAAVVVDGGTAAGGMELMGAARSRQPSALPVLVGVSPTGKVSYPGAEAVDGAWLEPHHTHFVLADSAEWGGETPLLIAVAETLSVDAPVVMVLAGGGRVATAEALEAATRGWPLFVIEGTAGAADEILKSGADAARAGSADAAV